MILFYNKIPFLNLTILLEQRKHEKSSLTTWRLGLCYFKFYNISG